MSNFDASILYSCLQQVCIFIPIMNKHQHHRYFTSQGHRDPLIPEQQYATDFFDKNASPPKKVNTENEPLKKDHISKPFNDEINRLSNEQFAGINVGSEDRRFKNLIIDAISSADRAIKAILPYGHTEIQKYCSVYFLNKEKLLSFLDANNRSFFSNSDRNSKKSDKRKGRKKDYGSSDLTEMVPINHLERLQKIVYNKIIPILQTQFETEKRRGQKLLKKGKQWGNSDLRQGLQLLQRLNDKQRIAIDQCAELLQKFIVRIMQKQQKMLNKISRMQEKLDEQIKKTQALSEQSKKWEQHRLKSEKQWNKQKKNMIRYQQFSREVKSIFTQKDKLNSQASQKQCLEDILQQLKRMLNNQQRHGKRQKKCDHKAHKETHISCKEQASKNEQQIKSLKQVVKSLDNQICLLRQQCQNMDAKLQHSNQKVSKFESKSKKIIEENDSMNKKIEEMMKQQSYKSKLIQQYLRMIAKLEENLKQSEENLIKLNEQNDSYLQMIAKHSSEKQDFIKHMMESEDKQKELLQLLSKKQTDYEELIHNLNAKEKEILDGQAVIQKLYKQIQQLYRLLKEKQQALLASSKQIETLSKQLKESKQVCLQLQAQNNHKNETPINIHKEQNHEKLKAINIDTMLSIQSPISPIKKSDSHILRQELPENIQKITQNQNIKEGALQTPKQNNLKLINSDQNMFQNKKDEERPDFIPARINKQTEEELQRQSEQYYSRTLKDDIEHVKQASNIEVNSHNSKSKNEDIGQFIKVEEVHIQDNHEEFQKKFKDFCDMKISQQLNTIQAESQKIQQLLDLNHRIGEHFNHLKQKIDQNEQLKAETIQIKEEMERLTMMLNMCKLNTFKRLQKLAKAEILHHQAQQEIQRLKHRLDDALIANQSPFSNIQQNSDGSGFTIPDHLQSFFKNNNNTPIQSTKFNQQYYLSRFPIKQKLSKEYFTQTDVEVQTINPPHTIAIQSEVIIQASWPIVSLVDEKQQEVNRSFINQLEDISPVMPIPNTVAVVDSLQNSEEVKGTVLPNSLKETPIENIINPKIPVAEVNPQNHSQQYIAKTPQRNPLANSAYFLNLMNAPQKQKNEAISSDKSFIEFRHGTQIQQMKEMFTQREQHFSELVVEREQQIERLKSIIKTLTKAQEIEERASPKTSRNKESINRQIQNLRTQNEQLWMFLQKERSQIERLQILIKQYQLHDELTKLKSVHHDYSDHHSQVLALHAPIQENLGFVYTMTPAKRVNQQKEIAAFQAENISKSQHLQEPIQNEAISQQKKIEVQEETLSAPKQTDSPSKRFARKSQKFQKEQSPRERRHTSPKTAMQFDWQDLVPQYFGKSPGKGGHN